MAMSDADKQRLMTPSGRPPVMFTDYRPQSPSVDLVPLWPPWPPPPWSMVRDESSPASSKGFENQTVPIKPTITPRQDQNVAPTSELMTTAMPKLDSPLTLNNNLLNIPWQQLLINLWRLAQPTGVTPGTYAGLTVNAFGQVIAATAAGAIPDAPHDGNIYGRQNGAWVKVP